MLDYFMCPAKLTVVRVCVRKLKRKRLDFDSKVSKGTVGCYIGQFIGTAGGGTIQAKVGALQERGTETRP